MDPVLAKVGPLTVRWYGLMYAVALLLGTFIIYREVKRKGLGLDLEDVLDFVLISFVFGLVGARIYSVLFNLDFFVSRPLAILGIGYGRSGFGISGLAIHGGLIGGLAGLIFCARRKEVDFWKLADSVAPALILGQALGRFGNFMNGDAFGFPTGLPWGIKFPDGTPAGNIYPDTPLHPVMLYEMVLNIFIFALLWRIRKKGYRDGFVASLYFVSYSVVRSAVSFFRADSLWIGPIRAAHLASIVLVAAFSYFIFRERLYEKKSS